MLPNRSKILKGPLRRLRKLFSELETHSCVLMIWKTTKPVLVFLIRPQTCSNLERDKRCMLRSVLMTADTVYHEFTARSNLWSGDLCCDFDEWKLPFNFGWAFDIISKFLIFTRTFHTLWKVLAIYISNQTLFARLGHAAVCIHLHQAPPGGWQETDWDDAEILPWPQTENSGT